jgi:hypothetical protein
MYRWFGLLLVLFSFSVNGQELNCNLSVGFDRITDANPQIFKTLERSLNDFINNTRFTSRNFAGNERIDCSIFINISAYNSGQFSATIQVQSSRPVYGSTYSSPVLNVNDKDFTFRYNESENLVYNPNSFDSNLVSVISFYANMIIGLDADTFEKEGGTPYYQTALSIANVAQSGGYKGWNQQDGNQTRYFLVNDILSNTYMPFREALYEYHFLGLDKMSDNQKEAKENIMAAIKTLSKVNNVRPNAYLTRTFFDAKADELVAIFSGGPIVSTGDLLNTLNRISPLNSSKWSNIK